MSPSSDPYRSSQKLGAGARQTEARALMETARALADAQGNMEDLSSYRAALRLNWRLWTIFQSDVSAAENPLPEDIKQCLITTFIDKHTVDALSNPEGRKLKVLIDISRYCQRTYGEPAGCWGYAAGTTSTAEWRGERWW